MKKHLVFFTILTMLTVLACDDTKDSSTNNTSRQATQNELTSAGEALNLLKNNSTEIQSCADGSTINGADKGGSGTAVVSVTGNNSLSTITVTFTNFRFDSSQTEALNGTMTMVVAINQDQTIMTIDYSGNLTYGSDSIVFNFTIIFDLNDMENSTFTGYLIINGAQVDIENLT